MTKPLACMYDDIMADEKEKQLFLCDILVNGRCDKERTELNMRFKGSLNQCIIDVSASVWENKVV